MPVLHECQYFARLRPLRLSGRCGGVCAKRIRDPDDDLLPTSSRACALQLERAESESTVKMNGRSDPRSRGSLSPRVKNVNANDVLIAMAALRSLMKPERARTTRAQTLKLSTPQTYYFDAHLKLTARYILFDVITIHICSNNGSRPGLGEQAIRISYSSVLSDDFNAIVSRSVPSNKEKIRHIFSRTITGHPLSPSPTG